MELSASPPAISVIIVCDYAAGEPQAWEAFRKSLAGLAAQNFQEKAEFILCESEEFRGRTPADLTAILPGLKILYAPESSAYALKNAAVEAASCELIAMLDADCVPVSGWLRRLTLCLREHPKAAAVSGKTGYGGKSISVRMTALLDRAFVDPGRAGETRNISDNNAGYRRSAYMAHPLPLDVGGFTGFVQSERMLHAGYELWFDPEICVEHEFEGWPMVADIRRNRGHAAIQTRLQDRSLPYGWAAGLGPIGILPLLWWKIQNSWRDCRRCRHHFGIRWYELPLIMMVSIGVTLLEAPGMLAAFGGRGLGESYFR